MSQKLDHPLKSQLSLPDFSQIQKKPFIENENSELQQLSSFLQQKQTQSISTACSKYRQIVGVLYSVWFSPTDNIMKYTYGSAFAISSRIIVTCTHNLYSYHRKQFANFIRFVPGILPAQSPDYDRKVYRATFIKKKKLPYPLCTQQPVKEELMMLYLQQELPNSPSIVYPALGNSNHLRQQKSKSKILVMGYSSSKLKNHILCKNDFYDPKAIQGEVHSTRRNKINYKAETGPGLDGGPLFAIKDNGDILAIGIHIHNKKYRNQFSDVNYDYDSGLYFSSEILYEVGERIKKVEADKGIKCEVSYNLDQVTQIFDGQQSCLLEDQQQKIELQLQQVVQTDQAPLIYEKPPKKQTAKGRKQKIKLNVKKFEQETAQVKQRIKKMYDAFEQKNSYNAFLKQQYKPQYKILDALEEKPASPNPYWPYLSIKPEMIVSQSDNQKQSRLHKQIHKEQNKQKQFGLYFHDSFY